MDLKASTPLHIIAHVARGVTRIVDRVTGDRSECPMFVAGAAQLALRQHGIDSHVLFGRAAWIEALDNGTVIWAGCFDEHRPYFWVETQFKETVDLNASVHAKHSKRPQTETKALYSPPMLWSHEVAAFYRYEILGAADISPTEEPHRRWWERIREELSRYYSPQNIHKLNTEDPEFPNEPLIAPGRRLLDDTSSSFQEFDKILSHQGLPPAPSFTGHK